MAMPKCGNCEVQVVDGDAVVYGINGVFHVSCSKSDAPNALSLLIIDMGDCCVVKVEKGTWHPDGGPHEYHRNHYLLSWTFTDLRAALDDAPVPRIEASWSQNGSGDIVPNGYYVYVDNNDRNEHWPQSRYDALSQLAGKPLPVWEGNGKWEELNPPPTVGISWELPFTAWRYSR